MLIVPFSFEIIKGCILVAAGAALQFRLQSTSRCPDRNCVVDLFCREEGSLLIMATFWNGNTQLNSIPIATHTHVHIKKFTLKSIISHSVESVALTFICVNEMLVHARDCSVN